MMSESIEYDGRMVRLIDPNTPAERKERAMAMAKKMLEAAKTRGPDHEFSIADFEIGKPLGRGKFGRVFLARDRLSHAPIALKTVIKEEIFKYQLSLQVMREIEIQARLDHKHILRLHTYFADEKRIYLVLEYAGKGELFTELHNQPHSRFEDSRAAKYIYQVADALEYCHRMRVIHRDLKPENILLDINDNIKLADFGWSVHAPSSKRKTMCGTVDYLPPEIVNRAFYDDRVDHWCLGVLTYELLVGGPPFESSDVEITYQKIKTIKIAFPSDLSSGSRHLINNLLKLEPKERISLEEVKSHFWITANYKPIV